MKLKWWSSSVAAFVLPFRSFHRVGETERRLEGEKKDNKQNKKDGEEIFFFFLDIRTLLWFKSLCLKIALLIRGEGEINFRQTERELLFNVHSTVTV